MIQAVETHTTVVNPVERELKCYQAINEAIDLSMAADPSVYIMGLGVPDPKGVFGTTLGLQQKYGEKRVMDMPTSENGMTGVAIGSALVGMRPILVHQRLDFALLSVEQIVNQAANWHYMYGGQQSVPLVIRFIVGRGWGQGPQHSQSLHSWFAHIPGLKVVVPATPYDAKGLLISSIEDNNPVIFIEHRWLHGISGDVPEGLYRVPIGKARVAKEGKDITIVALSYMTIEAIRAAQMLTKQGISAEVIDVRSLRPFDHELVLQSVRKTGALIVADTDWQTSGFSAEIIASICESGPDILRHAPIRITPPDAPSPSSPGLSKFYYPRAQHIYSAAKKMLGVTCADIQDTTGPFDVPDPAFTGPF
jgi:acetoin:2,6-dichlorophenolindophenol oxidoreductase subunit beta